MPIFDFKCGGCGDILEDVVLSCMHEDDEHPACYDCGAFMEHYITKAPMGFVTDTEFPVPFVAGKDKQLITGARQRREYMKANDLIDSNDLGTPPTHEDQMREVERVNDSIAAITPTEKQKRQLQADGIGDIV